MSVMLLAHGALRLPPVHALCRVTGALSVRERAVHALTNRQLSYTCARRRGEESQNNDPLAPFLESNRKWAEKTRQDNPGLIDNLSKGQSPQILWIGCSDSRIPETTVLGLKPGDVFVHRNIANVLLPTDLSSLSVIEYSVVYLKVKHIILCGHTSCGGVGAALGSQALGKIDTWLMPLRALHRQHAKEWEGLSAKEQSQKLVEANVKQGVEVLRENPDVMAAMKERGLTVHGCIYDLATGELAQVDTTDENEPARQLAFTINK